MRRWLRGLLVSFLASVAIFASACGSDPPSTILQTADLSKPEGADIAAFDRNAIVDPAAFTDIETLDVAAVQRFLSKTPYDQRPSFLETYQSNGVRAADTIVRAARQYRINPLVFLVFAEAMQGLIGERNYPFPPERVEYVFRCGCFAANNCLPTLAGFDRQVDCLGRSLRDAIEEIKLNEATASGWGPDKTSTTLDNVKVTPTTDVTAALYDRTPRVNEGEGGGTWIFWNIWNLYAPKLDYGGPVGSVEGRWIGEPCVVANVCGVQDAICATNYPDGLCTVPCTGQCPAEPSKPETFCAKFPDGGYCFLVCNPAAPSCRKGYKCLRVAGVGSGDSRHVCSPEAAVAGGG
jgi:hypothetical protein